MADCGFFIQYNDFVRNIAKVPVCLSSICQVAEIELMLGKNDKIAVMTANSASFDKPAM